MTLLDHGQPADTTTKKHLIGLVAVLAVLAVALVGACTSPDDAALSGSPPSGASAGSSSFPPATAQWQWAQHNDLLSAREVVAALGEWPPSDDSDAVDQGSGWCSFVPGPAVDWHASVRYTYMRSDWRVTTDVSECMFYSADRQVIAQMFADLQDQTPTYAIGPYPIGWLDAFAWELDGGSSAIDRFVVVNTGDALVAISAGRHSPVVAQGDNLTRPQVDHLVDAAVEKIASRSPLPTKPADDYPMPTEQQVAIMEWSLPAYYDAINAHDGDAIRATLTDDFARQGENVSPDLYAAANSFGGIQEAFTGDPVFSGDLQVAIPTQLEDWSRHSKVTNRTYTFTLREVDGQLKIATIDYEGAQASRRSPRLVVLGLVGLPCRTCGQVQALRGSPPLAS